MKAIVALLARWRKHLTHPRSNPTRRILHHHRQPQPLSLALARAAPPTPASSRVALERETDQIPPVEVHPDKAPARPGRTSHRAPGLDPGESVRVGPRRSSLGRGPASAESSRMRRSPQGRADGTKSSIGRMALGASTRNATTAPRRSCASSTRTSVTAAPWSSGDSKWLSKHRLRRRPNGVHRGPRNLELLSNLVYGGLVMGRSTVAMSSIPSLNLTPSMSFASWRNRRSRRQDFSAHRPIL